MTSAEKVKSNRANAKASTGPRTAKGKARVAQNARRHGLSIRIYADPRRSDEIEALAKRIAGQRPTLRLMEISRRIAEAQIELIRIRQARLNIVNEEFRDLDYGRRELVLKAVKLLVPYMREHGLRSPVAPEIAKLVDHRHNDPNRFALIAVDLTKQLTMIDRYERRALSRRKFAIREFDAVKKGKATAK